MKTLKEIKVGQSAIIKKIHGDGALKRRIMDMGITKEVNCSYYMGKDSGRIDYDRECKEK